MEEQKSDKHEKSAVSLITSGMYIFTSSFGEDRSGCIVSSVFCVSCDPFIVAVSVGNGSMTKELADKKMRFGLSVLSELSDPYYIARFGFQSGRDNDKFKKTGYEVVGETPVITDSCGYFVCDVIGSYETEKNTVIIGKVIKSECFENGAPMTYDYYKKIIGGITPSSSPLHVHTEQCGEGCCHGH